MNNQYQPWPELDYNDFKETAHLLHMGVQMLGKLKLQTPFEPHWNNILLNITVNGLSTGLIPYKDKMFSVELDLNKHEIITEITSGESQKFKLENMSVADFYEKFLKMLKQVEINISINPKPQEVPNPIMFDQDKQKQSYNSNLANAWWRILISSYKVFQIYHAYFFGKTQPVGFMWGTFDLRDVRFKDNTITVPTSGINTGYLRRNAMNAAQIESGWWSGNEAYPKAAYYSFTFPEPQDIDKTKLLPDLARWDNNLKLFILDYDDMRKTSNPDEILLEFLISTYEAGAKLANWDKSLIGLGKPI